MNEDQPHILVVDDDDRLRKLLQRFLGENGFLVATAHDAGDARAKLATIEFDLVVLDRMMPGESGIDLARWLRGRGDVPVLMLTAMGEPEDRIAGLEAGVDDYLPKPFEPRELVLRINSILRRVPRQVVKAETVRLGVFAFDPERGELTRDGTPVRLTDVEVALLTALTARPGEILSREELIARTGAQGADRAIDVQVARLRRKIEDDSRLPRYLQTVRGRGYLLRPD